MPGFDGTGPRGMGSLTGGGRGLCGYYGLPVTPTGPLQTAAPLGQQTYTAPIYPINSGIGVGRGFGGGRGFRGGRVRRF